MISTPEPETPTLDVIKPAFVPLENGFELEWRRNQVHMRLRFTSGAVGWVWIDYKGADEKFVNAPLQFAMDETKEAMFVLFAPLLESPRES